MKGMYINISEGLNESARRIFEDPTYTMLVYSKLSDMLFELNTIIDNQLIHKYNLTK